MNKTEYDYLTIGEILSLFKIYGDRPVIHNGHVIGFTKD